GKAAAPMTSSEKNHSKTDRPGVNIYWRTGSGWSCKSSNYFPYGKKRNHIDADGRKSKMATKCFLT
ncbi:MAG: hypothetical protein K2I56_10985, partial [Muribaculaceae bacterium]|nr:hypothetical protein [Muribaculaceae bacterium]